MSDRSLRRRLKPYLIVAAVVSLVSLLVGAAIGTAFMQLNPPDALSAPQVPSSPVNITVPAPTPALVPAPAPATVPAPATPAASVPDDRKLIASGSPLRVHPDKSNAGTAHTTRPAPNSSKLLYCGAGLTEYSFDYLGDNATADIGDITVYTLALSTPNARRDLNKQDHVEIAFRGGSDEETRAFKPVSMIVRNYVQLRDGSSRQLDDSSVELGGYAFEYGSELTLVSNDFTGHGYSQPAAICVDERAAN